MNIHSQRLAAGLVAMTSAATAPAGLAETKKIPVTAANFTPGGPMTARDGDNELQFVIDRAKQVPFTQSAVRQGSEPAGLGPDAKAPYFTVRFALPIPPAYTKTDVAPLTGMDPMVFRHNHSPGFEILPNGDALAVYFSTPAGEAEADPSTSFVQARLRYGSEDWDMPELFFKTRGCNDQSGLLWNDGGKIRFFGGGRDISDFVPFRMATSSDNGATWSFSVPQLDKPATDYTAQPITSAFRDPAGSIYLAMDAKDENSFLWRGTPDGVKWTDMGGRTGGRHSAIVPLDDTGKLLSLGGKNSDVNGWTPQNLSTDWGATWSASTASPFPPLGTAQRPSLIRLASGNLLFVTDSYRHKLKIPAAEGWKYGDRCVAAISKDNGATWHIKPLPVELPQYHRTDHPSLGYTTARQAPNGVIHLLTTVTMPALHYEINEAWILSDAGDVAPENSGGTVREFSENHLNGKPRSKWTARITPGGRYLLDGVSVDYYDSGAKQHEATYVNGRKTGEETFWSPDGKKIWTWQRDLKTNRATWINFWPDGQKRAESEWNIRPEARDLKRAFFGYVADGTARLWNEQGTLVSTQKFVNGDFADTPPRKLEKTWETEPTLKVPESVLFVPGQDFLYVSNVEGPNPWTKDGKGSVGKIGLDGKVIAVDWVAGLNSPKGLGLHDGKLYVADMDEVVVIDVAKAAIAGRIPIEGGKMVNDIAIDDKGVVYASDSATGKVHAIRDGKVSTLLEGLKAPNGLLAQDGEFYVAQDEGLHQLGADGKLRRIAGGMEGGVDGVVKLAGGDFIVTGWAGTGYCIKPDGRVQTLFDTRKEKINSADIGYNPGTNTIYVPTFFKNTVTAYEVK